jgi:uncharacterized protein (TIGR00369 family)
LDDKKIYAAVEQHIVAFYKENPFVKYLGMDVVSIKSGEVKLALFVAHEYTNMYKIAHGGVLMSLADTAMGAACLSCNKKVVTLDFNMNMIKAAPEATQIFALGRILHDGSRTMVAECELLDGKDNLLAKARGTFFVLERFLED